MFCTSKTLLIATFLTPLLSASINLCFIDHVFIRMGGMFHRPPRRHRLADFPNRTTRPAERRLKPTIASASPTYLSQTSTSLSAVPDSGLDASKLFSASRPSIKPTHPTSRSLTQINRPPEWTTSRATVEPPSQHSWPLPPDLLFRPTLSLRDASPAAPQERSLLAPPHQGPPLFTTTT